MSGALGLQLSSRESPRLQEQNPSCRSGKAEINSDTSAYGQERIWANNRLGSALPCPELSACCPVPVCVSLPHGVRSQSKAKYLSQRGGEFHPSEDLLLEICERRHSGNRPFSLPVWTWTSRRKLGAYLEFGSSGFAGPPPGILRGRWVQVSQRLLQTCCRGSHSVPLLQPPPPSGGLSPKCQPWPEPGRCHVHRGSQEQRLPGAVALELVLRWGSWGSAQHPQPPGLSVSGGDQWDLLLAVRPEPFPREPSVPSAPAAPCHKDTASEGGCGDPQLGLQDRGAWGHGKGCTDHFKWRGKEKVWKWRKLSDRFQSHLPLLFPHFVPEIN